VLVKEIKHLPMNNTANTFQNIRFHSAVNFYHLVCQKGWSVEPITCLLSSWK